MGRRTCARVAVLAALLVLLNVFVRLSPPAFAGQISDNPQVQGKGNSRAYLPLIHAPQRPETWGGNDFGYVGRDNLGSRDLAFNWIEIAGTGTEIAAGSWPGSDDSDLGRRVGPFPLGMYLPLYDSEYNAVFIHDAGNLHFGSAYYPAEWHVVRGLTYPGGFDTGQWNYVPGQSHVYYQRLAQPDRFIVEFRGLRLCCAGGTADLEILLFPSGEIRMQYLQIGSYAPERQRVGLASIFDEDPLDYATPLAGGRVVSFAYPQQPNHTYAPDERRWYSFLLPRQSYANPLNAVLLGPGEGNSQIIYAAGLGMLLRSGPGAAEWTAVTPSSNTTVTGGSMWNTRKYALSPDFASTGVVFAVGRGLIRSADRGNSWAEQGGPTGDLAEVTFSPAYASDSTLWVAGASGAWISTDAGLTWTNRTAALGASDFNRIRLSPDYARDRTLWAGTWAGRLYRSTDAGLSWSSVALPPIQDGGDQPVTVVDLQAGPHFAASHALFLLGGRGPGQGRRLYRSGDGGKTWVLQSKISYDSVLIRVDPGDPSDRTLYLGLGESEIHSLPLLRSRDGGVSWEEFSQGFPTTAGAMSALTFHSPSGRLYALVRDSSESTWLLTRPFGAGEWQVVSSSSPGFTTLQPAVSAGRSQQVTILAGAHRSDDEGRTWTPLAGSLPGGSLLTAATSPDYARDGTAIAQNGAALLRTTDWGNRWTSEAECYNGSINGQQLLALSPAFPVDRVAFAVCGDAVVRSTDGGVSWEQLFAGEATNVAVSPDFTRDQTVFAMQSNYYTTLRRSTDGGATWAANPGPWSAMLLRVSPAYATDHTVYAGANNSSSGGVFRTTDAGGSWTQLPLPVDYYVAGLALPAHASMGGALLVANQFAWTGVAWLSADQGRTWRGANSGLGDYGLRQAYVYSDLTDRVYTFNEHGMWWRAMGWR